MSARVKSVLIVAATLLLGFLLGVVADSALHRHRFAVMQRGNGAEIERAIMRRVHARSDQEGRLGETLKQFEPRFRALRDRHLFEIRALADSLDSALSGVLGPEQLQRLRPPGGPAEHGPRRRPPERRDDAPGFPPGAPVPSPPPAQ